MNEELIPVFLMSGETIGDVLYLPFTENETGGWVCSGGAELDLTSDIRSGHFRVTNRVF